MERRGLDRRVYHRRQRQSQDTITAACACPAESRAMARALRPAQGQNLEGHNQRFTGRTRSLCEGGKDTMER